MALGHQDPWLVGIAMYFKRDNTVLAGTTTQYPWLHLGDLDPTGPAPEVRSIEALVSETGRIKLRDKRIIEFIESYTITTQNLRQQILAFVFGSAPPINFTQSADPTKTITNIPMFKGDLIKTEDPTAKVLYYPERISGLYTGTVGFAVLTAISRANKTLTITGDISALLTPGDSIIVDRTGLANPKNCRSYTMVSDSFGGGNTTVVVVETPAADETAITGQVVHENGGTIYNQGLDWIPYLDHGFGYVKVMPAGAIVNGATNVSTRFALPAVSGSRIIKPKSLTNEVRGKGTIVFSRSGDSEKTYREFNCVITPQGTALAIEAFSKATLKVDVLSDLSSEEPAGRFLQAIGELPSNA